MASSMTSLGTIREEYEVAGETEAQFTDCIQDKDVNDYEMVRYLN